MKKIYISPKLELLILQSADIIVASGGFITDGEGAGLGGGNQGPLDPDLDWE